jgi:hypothetical protein
VAIVATSATACTRKSAAFWTTEPLLDISDAPRYIVHRRDQLFEGLHDVIGHGGKWHHRPVFFLVFDFDFAGVAGFASSCWRCSFRANFASRIARS